MGAEVGVVELVKTRCARCKKKVLMSPGRLYCFNCAMARQRQNAFELHHKRGRFYDEWKLKMRNAVKRL